MRAPVNQEIISKLITLKKALDVQESSESVQKAVDLTTIEINELSNSKLNNRNISISAEKYMQQINLLIGFHGLNLNKNAENAWNDFKLLVPRRRSFINEMSFHF